MPIVIKPKRSEVECSVPTTSDLAIGEIGMNSTDKILYTKNSSNVIVEVANATGVTEATATDNAIAMSIALG